MAELIGAEAVVDALAQGGSVGVVSRPRLFLNHVADYDWLIAVEFGRVEDGQPPDCWRGVEDRFAYLLDRPEGDEVGFKVLEFSEFDPEEDPGVHDGPERVTTPRASTCRC